MHPARTDHHIDLRSGGLAFALMAVFLVALGRVLAGVPEE